MERDLKDFLMHAGLRGIMTMCGIRKTTGSQNVKWPLKKVLLDSFNKPNQVLSTIF